MTSQLTPTADAVTVPSILQRLGWDRIGLLKMDIEGHEETVLSGNCDWLNLVDAICVEYHQPSGESKLARLANRFGFGYPQRLPGAIWFLTR